MQTATLETESTTEQEYQIEIFQVGTHLSGNLISRDYSHESLQEVVDTYDPSYFKAPLIFNFYAEDPHSPLGYSDRELVKSPFAFGYPSKLSLNGDRLVAHFKDISPEFVEMAKEHKILAVSASFYPENNQHNPYPGKLALRHIAGLGSEPPAVKGMPLQFSEGSNLFDLDNFAEHSYDDSEETLNYNCACDNIAPSLEALKNIMERQRELLIQQKGIEEADKIIPRVLIEAIDESSEEYLDETHEEKIENSDISDIYKILMDHTEKISAISNGLKYSMNQVIGIKGGFSDLETNLQSMVEGMFDLVNQRINNLHDLVLKLSSHNIVYLNDDNIEPEDNYFNAVSESPKQTQEDLLGYSEMQTKKPEDLEKTVAALKMERDEEKRKNYVTQLLSFMEAQCNQHHKILPSQLEEEKEFALSLLKFQEANEKIEFSESTLLPVIEQYKQSIANRPQLWTPQAQVVIESEDVSPRNFSEAELSKHGRKLKEQYKKKGKDISLHEAIDKVANGEIPEMDTEED